ncbi:MAG: hypothetical protein ACJZ33_03230 [Candidatus Poseidoniales archaeon]
MIKIEDLASILQYPMEKASLLSGNKSRKKILRAIYYQEQYCQN